MKVKMLVQIQGQRNSKSWPKVGKTIEVSDEEGAKLCAAGYAEPVAEHRAAEKAVVKPAAEQRTAEKAEPSKSQPVSKR